MSQKTGSDSLSLSKLGSEVVTPRMGEPHSAAITAEEVTGEGPSWLLGGTEHAAGPCGLFSRHQLGQPCGTTGGGAVDPEGDTP